MPTDAIYRGLTRQFLHDGCHNRAEAICRRLIESGEPGVGKLWIVPSNLQFGRIRVQNPLFIDWLVGATFKMPSVPYSDTVTLHGEDIRWRYHVVAATKHNGIVTAYDSTYGTREESEYLSLLSSEALEGDDLDVRLLARFTPYGSALSEQDFSATEWSELLRDLAPTNPQHPSGWGDYWLNGPSKDGFVMEEHFVKANQWHLQIEQLLQSQRDHD